MSAMLATVPEDVAVKVAEDIRDHGAGCVFFDREGRAAHVSPRWDAEHRRYVIVLPADHGGTMRVETAWRRTFE